MPHWASMGTVWKLKSWKMHMLPFLLLFYSRSGNALDFLRGHILRYNCKDTLALWLFRNFRDACCRISRAGVIWFQWFEWGRLVKRAGTHDDACVVRSAWRGHRGANWRCKVGGHKLLNPMTPGSNPSQQNNLSKTRAGKVPQHPNRGRLLVWNFLTFATEEFSNTKLAPVFRSVISRQMMINIWNRSWQKSTWLPLSCNNYTLSLLECRDLKNCTCP